MSNDYLYIFYHMPKCAGTTFAYHIRKNLKASQYLSLYREDVGLPPTGSYPKHYIDKLITKRVKKITTPERNRIKIIFGHFAPWGIHKYFNKKPYYFTFLRDPIQRTVSYYNYWCKSFFQTNIGEPVNDKINSDLLKNGTPPSLIRWLKVFYRFEYSGVPRKKMIGLLIRSNYIAKRDIKRKSAVEMLKRFNFIGITEKFDQDSLYMYNKLGFNKFFDSQNISPIYFRQDIMNKTSWNVLKKRMGKINEIDYKIYHKALELRSEFVQDSKDFGSSVSYMKLKIKIAKPVTQLTSKIGRYLNLTKTNTLE